MAIDSPPQRSRWTRAHRFALSDLGRAAEREYREDIVSSRTQQGRASFDAARASWAERHKLQPDDGLYLGELAQAQLTLTQLLSALESCGRTKSETLDALGRLSDAGMLSDDAAAR